MTGAVLDRVLAARPPGALSNLNETPDSMAVVQRIRAIASADAPSLIQAATGDDKTASACVLALLALHKEYCGLLQPPTTDPLFDKMRMASVALAHELHTLGATVLSLTTDAVARGVFSTTAGAAAMASSVTGESTFAFSVEQCRRNPHRDNERAVADLAFLLAVADDGGDDDSGSDSDAGSEGTGTSGALDEADSMMEDDADSDGGGEHGAGGSHSGVSTIASQVRSAAARLTAAAASSHLGNPERDSEHAEAVLDLAFLLVCANDSGDDDWGRDSASEYCSDAGSDGDGDGDALYGADSIASDSEEEAGGEYDSDAGREGRGAEDDGADSVASERGEEDSGSDGTDDEDALDGADSAASESGEEVPGSDGTGAEDALDGADSAASERGEENSGSDGTDAEDALDEADSMMEDDDDSDGGSEHGAGGLHSGDSDSEEGAGKIDIAQAVVSAVAAGVARASDAFDVAVVASQGSAQQPPSAGAPYPQHAAEKESGIERGRASLLSTAGGSGAAAAAAGGSSSATSSAAASSCDSAGNIGGGVGGDHREEAAQLVYRMQTALAAALHSSTVELFGRKYGELRVRKYGELRVRMLCICARAYTYVTRTHVCAHPGGPTAARVCFKLQMLTAL